MEAHFADEIRQRMAREKTRTGYPAGFPALPPVPAARYCDPAFFQLEREHVFGRNWLFVAHVDEVAAPGDVMLLDQFPQPVMLVRGEDGRIRAFFNTCRHRGGPLVREARAHVKTRLVCHYHSWSYDLEGRLRGVPESENFANLNRGCLGLGAVACDTWAGMVFINFDRNAGPLRDFLAPIRRNMDDEIGDGVAPFQSRFAHKQQRRLRGNWKLATDANMETYHVNTVHRTSLTPILEQKATAIWLLEQGHSRMFIGQYQRFERNPLLPRFPRVSAITGEGQYAYLIYPNVIMGVSETMIFIAQAWPLAPGEMRYDSYYMLAAPLDERNRTACERMIAATERILEEDLGNLTFMQNSFEAGTLESIPLSYQERRLYYLHEAIDRSIGAELIPARLRVQPVLSDFIER